MRLSRAPFALLFSLGLIVLCNACGGGNTKPNVASTITITTTNISLTRGEVAQLSPTASNSNGTIVTVDFVYSTGDPTLVNVTSSGVVCAGTWNAAATICTPTTKTGSTTITITAKNSTATLPVTAFVHERIDSIQAKALPDCVSSAGQTQLYATAYSDNEAVCGTGVTHCPLVSTDPAVCGAGVTTPCEFKNSHVGDFTWHSADSAIVSVDNATKPAGKATAQSPGTGKVYASIGETNSPNVTFTTCPIVSLTLTRDDTSDTSPFSLDAAGTKAFTAVAKDSKGATITGPVLNWNTNNAYGFTIAGSTSATTATATAAKAASTATLSVSCSHPNCNKNLIPVWGPPIVATSNGTTAGSVVYAASTQSLTVYPIDGTTLGTAITLPRLPNSFLMNRQGTSSIMGSNDGGLMFLDPTVNTVSTATAITGAKALAVSPNGSLGAAANSTDLFILDMTTKALSIDLKLPGITSFAFVPGSNIAFASKGNQVLYQLDVSTGVYSAFPTTASVNGITAVSNGPIVYVSEPGGINVYGTCDPTAPRDTQVATTPTMIESLPTAQGAVAVDMPNMVVVNSSNIDQACPPAVSDSRLAFDLGLGSVTPAQLAVSLDSTKAVVTTNSAKLAIADVKNGQSSVVTLAAGATASYQGAITHDSLNFYVGGSDGTLHRIDLNGKTDAAQITVGLKKTDNSTTAIPDLVQLKGK